MEGIDAVDEADAAGEPAAGTLSEYAASLMAAQPFKGYEIRDCLGSTGVSAAFKAKDLGMERTVVVKAVRPSSGREGAVEEFFPLAGSMARVRTPVAARAFDAGRAADGSFFMAYAHVPGDSLAERLERRQTGRMTEKESLRLAVAMAEALHGLYQAGQFHGNFKPSNLIFVEGGKVVLTDIGFAWNVAWPTDAEAFLARPGYLAPERIDGDANIDIRGDLYSLGAVWYRALLGVASFAGDDAAGILRRRLDDKPAPPRELDPRLSAATSNLIMWLLERDRDARPRSPREFLRKMASHPLATRKEPERADDAGQPEQPEAAETTEGNL